MEITFDNIKEIIKEIDAVVDKENMKVDIPLAQQGIDSLDMLSIYLSIEERFNISIPDEDTNRLKSINNIINYIKEKKKRS